MPDLTAQLATKDGRDDLPDVLLTAATVMETRGWHQGDFFDMEARFARNFPMEKCAVCARGALNVAAGYDPTGPEAYSDARDDAIDALAFHLGYDPEDNEYEDARHFVTSWNDTEATSAEQVITALRECAAELKASTR